MANGEDYWTTGRTFEKLGLTGKSLESLLRYVKNGKMQ